MMELGPSGEDNLPPEIPPVRLSAIRSHEIHDEKAIEIYNQYIDDLISQLDTEVAQKLAEDLRRLKTEHQSLPTTEAKHAWFRKTFSFLHNKMGHLSPRLFVYFGQHECLYLSSTVYWFDQLSARSKERVGEKMVELLNQADTPRRQNFFLMLPRHIMAQGGSIELRQMEETGKFKPLKKNGKK
jgi:hypothetical protein